MNLLNQPPTGHAWADDTDSGWPAGLCDARHGG